MKQKLIIIAGPTASGKTNISIELAKKLNGEIISADSMQVYKHMNIGTAKPSLTEMQGVKHYLIDILNPDEPFSAQLFQKYAKESINEIAKQGKIPILVGGTGFYINSILYNNEFTQYENNFSYRKNLENILIDKGLEDGKEYLFNLLKEKDLEYTYNLHKNNIKKVIRALEYIELSGNKMSEHNKNEQEKELYYDTCFILLDMQRDILYNRIETRIYNMLKNGLVEEVESLINLGYSKDLQSMQGLGYKEIIPYLENKLPLEEATKNLILGTRHFAKRQLTWFRNQNKKVDTDIINPISSMYMENITNIDFIKNLYKE